MFLGLIEVLKEPHAKKNKKQKKIELKVNLQ